MRAATGITAFGEALNAHSFSPGQLGATDAMRAELACALDAYEQAKRDFVGDRTGVDRTRRTAPHWTRAGTRWPVRTLCSPTTRRQSACRSAFSTPGKSDGRFQGASPATSPCAQRTRSPWRGARHGSDRPRYTVGQGGSAVDRIDAPGYLSPKSSTSKRRWKSSGSSLATRRQAVDGRSRRSRRRGGGVARGIRLMPRWPRPRVRMWQWRG